MRESPVQRLKEAVGSKSLVPRIVVDETIAELERLRGIIDKFSYIMENSNEDAWNHLAELNNEIQELEGK